MQLLEYPQTKGYTHPSTLHTHRNAVLEEKCKSNNILKETRKCEGKKMPSFKQETVFGPQHLPERGWVEGT